MTGPGSDVLRYYGMPQPSEDTPPPKKRRKPGPQPPKNGPRPLRMRVDHGGHTVVPYGTEQVKPARRFRKGGRTRKQMQERRKR